MKSYSQVPKPNSNSASKKHRCSGVSSNPDAPSLAASPLAWILVVPSCLELWPLVSPYARPSSTWPAIIPWVKRVGPPGGAVKWTCTHRFKEMWGLKQLSVLLWSLSSWERMGSLERGKQSKREEGTGKTPRRTGGDKKHGKCHESQRRMAQGTKDCRDQAGFGHQDLGAPCRKESGAERQSWFLG